MDLTRCVETLNILGDESRIRLCALLRERDPGTRRRRAGREIGAGPGDLTALCTHLARLNLSVARIAEFIEIWGDDGAGVENIHLVLGGRSRNSIPKRDNVARRGLELEALSPG